MNRARLIITSFLIFPIILSTGCSGEPSSNDIENVIKLSFEQANELVKLNSGGFFGDELLIKVFEIKKIACTKSQNNNGFNCDVETDISAPFVGRNKSTHQYRFVKASDGWQVIQ